MRKKRYNYFDDDEEVIRQIRQRTAEQKAKSADSADNSANRNRDSNHAADAIHSATAEAKAIAAKTKRAAQRVAAVGIGKFEKEENRAPRRLAMVISLVMVLVMIVGTVGVVSVNINHGVNRDERFNTAAGEICAQYVAKYGNCNYEDLQAYGVSGYRLTGVCCVRPVDFNGDNDSELLICYRDNTTYYAEVWAFHGKKFDMVYKDKLCQTKDKKDDIWVTLYYKNGKYQIAQHDEKKPEQATLFAMRHNKFVQTGTCTYDPVADAFTVNRKVNTDDFERIKMSVLRETAAATATDNTNDAIASMQKDDEPSAAKKKKGSAMNMAYYSIVKSLNEKYGVAKFHNNPGIAYISGLAVVRLVDFDHDGTNELLTIYRRSVTEMGEDGDGNYHSEAVEKYYCAIYAWNGKLATQVYSTDGLSNSMTNDHDRYYVLEKDHGKINWCTNHFLVENYGRTVQATSKVLAFDDDAFNQKTKAYYETDYGYTGYYLNDRWSNKTEFADNGGFDVPFFDGGTTYDEDRYLVTYVQTKAANQEAVRGVVDDTVDTIRKLDNSYNPDDVVSAVDKE